MKKTAQHLIIISALGAFFHNTQMTFDFSEHYLFITRYSWLELCSSYVAAASLWLFLFNLLRPALCMLAWCIRNLIRAVDALGELDAKLERWARRRVRAALRNWADRLADPSSESLSEVTLLNQHN